MKRIRITLGELAVSATLNDSRTAEQLWGALPIEARAQRWGDEVYFEIPLEAGEENPQPAVPSGAVAYWPPGRALCLFFGQTPYSPVNLVGELAGDPNLLSAVEEGEAVRVERE
jgi:hypothetical protein